MWNFKKIKKSLDLNGYFEFKNYLTKKDIKKVEETLLTTLNYIKKSNQKNLQKKYYEIKKYSPKLKGNWYDIAKFNIDLLKSVHKDPMVEFVKKYFNTKVVFSGRPAIHVHDNENDRLLDAHQETNQFARDTIVLWIPIYDTNKKTGGLTVYEKSHKSGYFKHSLDHPGGKKSWTSKYTNINKKYLKKFKEKNLEVKSGNAIIFLSSLVHSGYENSDPNSVRITITERFNPLKKLPFLKDTKASMKMPYVGVDYNKLKID
jgi:hypothetical protein